MKLQEAEEGKGEDEGNKAAGAVVNGFYDADPPPVLRVEYLKPNGKIIVSKQQIDPMPVITGQAEYPKDLIGMMKNYGFEVTVVDRLGLAEEAGSAKAVNLVLMGVMSNHFSFPEEAWQEAIDACVPAKVFMY